MLKSDRDRPSKGKNIVSDIELTLTNQQSDVVYAESDLDGKSDEKYCYCRGLSYGDMVECENPKVNYLIS